MRLEGSRGRREDGTPIDEFGIVRVVVLFRLCGAAAENFQRQNPSLEIPTSHLKDALVLPTTLAIVIPFLLLVDLSFH